jgi:hypothetical protein
LLLDALLRAVLGALVFALASAIPNLGEVHGCVYVASCLGFGARLGLAVGAGGLVEGIARRFAPTRRRAALGFAIAFLVVGLTIQCSPDVARYLQARAERPTEPFAALERLWPRGFHFLPSGPFDLWFVTEGLDALMVALGVGLGLIGSSLFVRSSVPIVLLPALFLVVASHVHLPTGAILIFAGGDGDPESLDPSDLRTGVERLLLVGLLLPSASAVATRSCGAFFAWLEGEPRTPGAEKAREATRGVALAALVALAIVTWLRSTYPVQFSPVEVQELSRRWAAIGTALDEGSPVPPDDVARIVSEALVVSHRVRSRIGTEDVLCIESEVTRRGCRSRRRGKVFLGFPTGGSFVFGGSFDVETELSASADGARAPDETREPTPGATDGDEPRERLFDDQSVLTAEEDGDDDRYVRRCSLRGLSPGEHSIAIVSSVSILWDGKKLGSRTFATTHRVQVVAGSVRGEIALVSVPRFDRDHFLRPEIHRIRDADHTVLCLDPAPVPVCVRVRVWDPEDVETDWTQCLSPGPVETSTLSLPGPAVVWVLPGRRVSLWRDRDETCGLGDDPFRVRMLGLALGPVRKKFRLSVEPDPDAALRYSAAVKEILNVRFERDLVFEEPR